MKKILAFCLLFSSSSFAAMNTHHNHGGDVPISVMGDHVHEYGDWMASYRYMNMEMNDLYDGESKVDPSDLKGKYAMAPVKMSMFMQTFGMMKGINETNTVMVMMPYIEKKMDMVHTTNASVTRMRSEGFGDIKIIGLTGVDTPSYVSNINWGISIPAGSIKEGDQAGSRLPYAMQLGSGTYDPIIGITQIKQNHKYSYGYQAKGTFRLGRNSQGYSLGEKYELTSWFTKVLTPDYSSSIKLKAVSDNNIDGKDGLVETGMSSPSRRSYLTGGTKLSGGLGFSYNLNDDHRLAIEYSFPLYQRLHGPQLTTNKVLMLGIQKAF